MTQIIKKTWNTYKRHDGYIMGWERSEEPGVGHKVSILDELNHPIDFQWRSNIEPEAGQRVSIVMVDEGVSTRKDRPILVMNHDTGEVLREQNAPPTKGTRSIMISLWIWVLSAMAISSLIIANTTGVMMMSLTLLATALIVWRLAIATSELRYEERAQKRIQDEEKLCLEIMTSAWRMAAGEVVNMKKTEI